MAFIGQSHLMRMLAINAAMIANAHEDISVMKIHANEAAFENDDITKRAFYRLINQAKRFIAATAVTQKAIKQALQHGKRWPTKHGKNDPRYQAFIESCKP